MKNTGDTLPRRAFLSGAASLLGSAALARTPRPDTQAAVGGFAVYFWNGLSFVDVSQAHGQPNGPTARVEIQEVMGSATPVAIDADLPGGAFHAYVGTPSGSGRAAFTAPYSDSAVSFSLAQGTTAHALEFGVAGFYLVVSAHQNVSTLMLIQGTVTTVIDTSGAPLSTPTILIRIQ